MSYSLEPCAAFMRGEEGEGYSCNLPSGHDDSHQMVVSCVNGGEPGCIAKWSDEEEEEEDMTTEKKTIGGWAEAALAARNARDISNDREHALLRELGRLAYFGTDPRLEPAVQEAALQTVVLFANEIRRVTRQDAHNNHDFDRAIVESQIEHKVPAAWLEFETSGLIVGEAMRDPAYAKARLQSLIADARAHLGLHEDERKKPEAESA